MEVYFGGAFQGKLEYVLEKKGCLKVADHNCCFERNENFEKIGNEVEM